MSKFILLLIPFLLGFNSQEEGNVVQMEGFYESDWERSAFYEIRNNTAYGTDWLEFNPECKLSDSINNIFESNILIDNFYIKIKAKKTEGGSYGHLNTYKREIEVLEVIEIDTTFSLNDFLKERNIEGK